MSEGGHGEGPAPALATRLTQAGRRSEWTHGIVNPPVYHASTCTFETLEEFDWARANPDDGLYYGRRGTPTTWALEEALTEIEPGAAGTKLFPSGLAAIATAFLAVVKPGDHVLIADSVYEPTRALAGGLLKRIGAEPQFYDPTIGQDIADLVRDETTCVYVESPGSLTFEVQDVKTIAAAAHSVDAVVIADNTWATSLLFQPIEQGVDLVVQSLSKFVVGHSDAMLGSLTANQRLLPRMKAGTYRLGQVAAPDDAYLGLRGLRTLGPRMQRHGKNAIAVGSALAEHPAVARVLCPALPGDPGHGLWERDFSGASSLFTLMLDGGKRENLAVLIDGLSHYSIGFSFGGYESLVLPVDPAPLRTATRFEATGPMLRVHVGLEDPDDLIADLSAGLDRYRRAAR